MYNDGILCFIFEHRTNIRFFGPKTNALVVYERLLCEVYIGTHYLEMR